MIIAFTGHRDKVADPQELLSIEVQYPKAVWIHGGAKGFDKQVRAIGLELGKQEGVDLITHKPDYQRYGSSDAPLIRNRIMVDKADLLVVCWDGRKRGGTFQCKNYAKLRKVPTVFIEALDAQTK